MSTFLAFFVIWLELVSRTESVQQKHSLVDKKISSFYPFSLFHCTDSIRQMSLMKCQNCKKVNMVKLKITLLIKIDWGTF